MILASKDRHPTIKMMHERIYYTICYYINHVYIQKKKENKRQASLKYMPKKPTVNPVIERKKRKQYLKRIKHDIGEKLNFH